MSTPQGAKRSGSAAIWLLVAAAGFVVLAWVSSAGPGLGWSPDPAEPGTVMDLQQRRTESEQARCASDERAVMVAPGRLECEEGAGFHPLGPAESAVEIAVQVLTLAGLLAIAIWAAPRVRRRLAERRRSRREHGDPEHGDPDDVAGLLADELERPIAPLRQGPPRNAIVACWVRLQDAVARAGLDLRASETSAELTVRVLTAHLTDADALTRLASLYREARFSDHEVTDAMREEALAALERMRDDLRRTRAAAGAGAS